MNIDLSTCEAGDILVSKHGVRLTYVRKLDPEIDYYDCEVAYPDGGKGTRTNSGHVMKNLGSRLPEDEDIVEIIRSEPKKDKL